MRFPCEKQSILEQIRVAAMIDLPAAIVSPHDAVGAIAERDFKQHTDSAIRKSRKLGEIAIVHCSIVICHLWKESFFLK
jgi:hypothetical protein